MNIQPELSSNSKTISASSRTIFSTSVLHYNDTEEASKMQLIVTKTMIYFQKNNTVIHQFYINDIDAITESKFSNELIIHMKEEEDKRIDLITSKVHFLKTLLYILSYKGKVDDKSNQGLQIYTVEDEKLELYTTSNEDIKEGHRIRPDDKYCTLFDYKKFIENEIKDLNGDFKLIDITNQEKTVKNTRIDDFELIKVLGKGAHGKVLLARNNRSGKLQALKIIKKQHIIESRQLEHTISEKNVLTKLQNPFIVSLSNCFHTEHKVYFVMEFMKGGELFQHLRSVKKFTEEQAKFMIACIIIAIGHLHDHGYIYRDLKPENILLDEQGYCKLTDFGLSKPIEVHDLAKTFCGTPEYMPPEVIMDKGNNRPGDWWSLGVLLYEMIYGIPPFYSTNVQKMYKNTVVNPLKFKKNTQCSEEAKDFIAGLLIKDPRKRLGSIADINELMAHPWFKGFDWQALKEKRLEPPYKPSNYGSSWESYFDPEFMKMKAKDSICDTSKAVISQYEDKFAEFDYVDPDFELEIPKGTNLDKLSTIASEKDDKNSQNDSREENNSWLNIKSNNGINNFSRNLEGLKKNKSQGNECEKVFIAVPHSSITN